MHGHEVWGSRPVLTFSNFYVIVVNFRCYLGFGPNLNVFVNLLLNKRVYDTLKHNSPNEKWIHS